MDKMMDNPWFLRVTALLLALLLFFTVKADGDSNNGTTNDTQILTDIPVEVYYNREQVVVSGIPEMVSMRISGPSSIVQTTAAMMDFTLFVDLRSLTIGEHQVMIQSENLSEQLRVRIDPSYLNVTIEERVTEEFTIEPEINEQALAEGYVIESMTAEPDTVSVTGAKSAIDSISFVKATLAAEEGIDESFVEEARIRVLDSDLKQPTVTIEPETVEVTVEVAEYSREVPVSIKPTGEAPEGIVVNKLTPSAEAVRITGPRSAVDAVNEYVVDVDRGMITSDDSTVEVSLDPPKGTKSVTPGELTIEADITTDNTAAAEEAFEDGEV